jgi:hypothetical protein
MRMPGYCEKCRKVANSVQVSNAGMARIAMRGVPTGTCSNCLQTEDEDRVLRRNGHDPRRMTPRQRQDALTELRRNRRMR